jgi:cellulose synthase/poly-beta-1,6-N-acetylglucosamine synthase-like glycosyltransferase
MKKVSILIPAYNEEKYIGKCLDSIMAIKSEEIEIIVCDNNSTDTTCAIIKRYPTVQLVHETKVGPNAARQKAFVYSTGEIIATLDADCIVPKNWIVCATKHFQNQKVIGVSGVCIFNGTSTLRIALAFTTNYVMRFFHWLLHRVLKNGAIMPSANAWMRRSALIAIGGFNTDIAFHGDDTHTAYELAKKGIIIYDPKVVVTTSARRFDQGGWWTTSYRYIGNFVSTWLRNKQITSEKNTHHYR